MCCDWLVEFRTARTFRASLAPHSAAWAAAMAASTSALVDTRTRRMTAPVAGFVSTMWPFSRRTPCTMIRVLLRLRSVRWHRADGLCRKELSESRLLCNARGTNVFKAKRQLSNKITVSPRASAEAWCSGRKLFARRCPAACKVKKKNPARTLALRARETTPHDDRTPARPRRAVRAE